MNDIYIGDDFISAYSSYAVAEYHKHWMPQLFLMSSGVELQVKNQTVLQRAVLVDADTEHCLRNAGAGCYTILLDPTSARACILRKRLGKENFGTLTQLQDVLPGKSQHEEILKQIWNRLRIEDSGFENSIDSRVLEAQRRILKKQSGANRVSDIAADLFISESRLSHLFKESYGITLSGYILMLKWKTALQEMVLYGDITEAAMKAGFDSSSHFARINRKLTGMTGKEFSKNSRFVQF